MPKGSKRQSPMQPKKGKDEREWTTPEQKAHLMCKQGEYSTAQSTKSLAGWLSTELEIYFELFPTQPITPKESLEHPEWSLEDKKQSEVQRVKTWFKNHTRPSTHLGNGKREVFKLRGKPRKLSDSQRFSKLYYRFYAKLITSEWRKTYAANYKRVKENSTVTDVKEMKNQINELIREDLAAGLPDKIDAEASCPRGDEGYSGPSSDEEEEDTGLYSDDEASSPRVPIWYRNVVMKKLWEKASPSQRDEVEKQKKEEDEEDSHDWVRDDESAQNKVGRLQSVINRRTGLERFMVGLLNQVFKETGLVGSISLAGPDPQKGGKLVSMSIHKSLKNGLNFADVYPNFHRAVADPMCSYASLFFPPNERSKWALPGTEQPHTGQRQGLAALHHPSPGPLAIAQNSNTSPYHVIQRLSQAQALLSNPLDADDDTVKNSGEMEESENTSRQWEAEYDGLVPFDDAANEGNTHEEATQEYWDVDSTGGNVAEGRAPSVAPTAATLNAPVSLSGLQKVSESGSERELVNAGGDKDAKGLEGRQVMRATSRTLNTDTNTSSRPVRSKKLDAPGPSTRSSRASSGNSRKRGREHGANSEPPSKKHATRSSQVKTRRRKRN